jgi:protein-S-isoprenylcysteine O-methyltransferase Ste14
MATGWRPRNIPVPQEYLAVLALAIVAHLLRPWDLPFRPAARHLIGWPLVIAGAYLVVGAVRAAGPIDLERPARLVTDGPYARIRNPMYAGWALASLGLGLVADSGWIVAAVPLAAVVAHRAVLREERRLAESFGADFAAYRSRVPRYLGRSAR